MTTRGQFTFIMPIEPRILTAQDEFTLPDVLGDFCVKAARFFE
jgi:hypothetical protein